MAQSPTDKDAYLDGFKRGYLEGWREGSRLTEEPVIPDPPATYAAALLKKYGDDGQVGFQVGRQKGVVAGKATRSMARSARR